MFYIPNLNLVLANTKLFFYRNNNVNCYENNSQD